MCFENSNSVTLLCWQKWHSYAPGYWSDRLAHRTMPKAREKAQTQGVSHYFALAIIIVSYGNKHNIGDSQALGSGYQ